jgi:hypothetical protein
MKHIAITLTLIGTLSSAATAATMPDDKTDATLICRPASKTEHANASIKDPAADLVCKPFSIAMKMSDGTMHVIGSATASSAQIGPDISRAITPQQVNDTWVNYLESTFRISHSS